MRVIPLAERRPNVFGVIPRVASLMVGFRLGRAALRDFEHSVCVWGPVSLVRLARVFLFCLVACMCVFGRGPSAF